MRPGAGAGGGYDVVVIGAGLAGLTAACRLAEGGAGVLVLAKGVGATHLFPGTIDVLGYAPELVEHPAGAFAQFVADRPGHPYGLLGLEPVAAALEWFRSRFEDDRLPGYAYTGGLDRNLMLPTAVGVPKPSALVPESMAAGDVRTGGSVAIVSFRSLRDFHPAYLADNLSRVNGGSDVAAEGIILDLRPEDRVEANALGLARAFDHAEFRARVAQALAGRLEGIDRVGFPAALGFTDPHAVWSDMQQRLERPVFEVPTLPPSVPGMRADRVLRAHLSRADGRIVLNSPVTGVETEGDRISVVRAQTAGREVGYAARAVVLATGGFASGGLTLDSRWQAREAVLGLPVAQLPATGERFLPRYFDPQPMARAGVAANAGLRPLDERGEPLYANVHVAGATLAGSEPWKEKSGAGLSLATGHRAAELILGALA